MNVPYLSVVVPVYNESKRLEGVSTIAQYLQTQRFTSELIVVNDGSTDDTLQQLDRIKAGCDLQVVSYQPNHGKGYAIKQGMLAAHGAHRLFTDVDLSTPVTEFEKFIPHLGQCEVVIASRKQQNASVIRHQPRLRENLGKGFTFLSRVVLQVPLSDFTCGFKCFSGPAAQAIFSRMTIDGWGFDSEAMFVAHKRGYVIKEVPVTWTNDPRTKVKLPDDIIRSISELITIRTNSLKGKYR
jgi:dolichyl-phosphate beta-glucosyltransferase